MKNLAKLEKGQERDDGGTAVQVLSYVMYPRSPLARALLPYLVHDKGAL